MGVFEPFLRCVAQDVLDLRGDVQPLAVRPVLAGELFDEVPVLRLGLGLVLDERRVADAALGRFAREHAFEQLGRAGRGTGLIHHVSPSE